MKQKIFEINFGSQFQEYIDSNMILLEYEQNYEC